MKSFSLRAFWFAALVLLLGGCASVDTQLDRDLNPVKFQRFFVVQNANDNRAMDRRIAEALRARGYQAENGYLTMMPDDYQVIVTFQDQWAWDFKDHLASLRISMREANKPQNFANASLAARLPLREDPSVSINRLLDRLFSGAK
ncbi:hypothetical protein [Oleiharenicola lentus]|uniref:hypothetical protein n=1 Tax=Oleiharenicola lentus TaxID=2508720 RepID=UPI003F6705FB